MRNDLKQFKDFKYRNELDQTNKGVLEPKDKDHIRNQLKKVFGGAQKMLLNGFKQPLFVFLPKSLLQTHAASLAQIVHNLTKLIIEYEFDNNEPPTKDLNFVVNLTSIIIASQSYCLELLKPMQPIIGETQSIDYGDGIQGYFEMVSEDPPTHNYFITKEGLFRLQGTKSLSEKMHLRYIEGFSHGCNYIELMTSNKKYQFSDANLALLGYLKFEISFLFVKSMWIKDITSGIISMIDMDEDKLREKDREGVKGDRFRCFITYQSVLEQIEENIGKDNLFDQIERYHNEDPSITFIKGFGFSTFNKQEMINNEKIETKLFDIDDQDYNQYFTDINDDFKYKLPSDSSYREDIHLLSSGELDKATKVHTKIQDQLKKDAKQRKRGQHKKKGYFWN